MQTQTNMKQVQGTSRAFRGFFSRNSIQLNRSSLPYQYILSYIPLVLLILTIALLAYGYYIHRIPNHYYNLGLTGLLFAIAIGIFIFWYAQGRSTATRQKSPKTILVPGKSQEKPQYEPLKVRISSSSFLHRKFHDYFALALFVLGLGVLAYSFYYLNYYNVHGYAKSFFPWKWMITYHSLPSIKREFYDGLGASVFLILVSLGTFFYYNWRGRHPISQSISIPKPLPEIQRPQRVVEESRRIRREQERETQTIFSILESRLGKKSRSGAVVLSGIAIIMLLVSSRFPNPVLEFDSVIAFVGALVLIFMDTSHSIQARVVDRVLDSSKALIDELSSKLGEPNFLYMQMGNSIKSVFIVPAERAARQATDTSESSPGQLLGRQEETHLIPFGRGLAELFIKEMGITKPSMESVVNSAQRILCDNLQLAERARITRTANRVEVMLTHPTFKSSCNPQPDSGAIPKSGTIGCEVCSVHAVIASFCLSKSVLIEECDYDSESDSTKVALEIGQH